MTNPTEPRPDILSMEGTVPYCRITRTIIDHIRSDVPPHDLHSVWSHPYITAEDARRIRTYPWQMEPVNG